MFGTLGDILLQNIFRKTLYFIDGEINPGYLAKMPLQAFRFLNYNAGIFCRILQPSRHSNLNNRSSELEVEPKY